VAAKWSGVARGACPQAVTININKRPPLCDRGQGSESLAGQRPDLVKRPISWHSFTALLVYFMNDLYWMWHQRDNSADCPLQGYSLFICPSVCPAASNALICMSSLSCCRMSQKKLLELKRARGSVPCILTSTYLGYLYWVQLYVGTILHVNIFP